MELRSATNLEGGGIPSVSVVYLAQIKLQFLAHVRVWTRVDLVTGSSLNICLLMRISRGKVRPLLISKIDTGLTYGPLFI